MRACLIGLLALSAVLMSSTRASAAEPDPDSGADRGEVSRSAFHFGPEEKWVLHAQGPTGRSELRGRMLRLDFTRGAEWFAVRPSNSRLPGGVALIRVRVYGRVTGVPLILVLRTDSATYQKLVGSFDGDGHLELESAGPPGPGWDCRDGEINSPVRGPLQIGEIRFVRPTKPAVVELELEEILVHVTDRKKTNASPSRPAKPAPFVNGGGAALG